MFSSKTFIQIPVDKYISTGCFTFNQRKFHQRLRRFHWFDQILRSKAFDAHSTVKQKLKGFILWLRFQDLGLLHLKSKKKVLNDEYPEFRLYVNTQWKATKYNGYYLIEKVLFINFVNWQQKNYMKNVETYFYNLYPFIQIV